MLEFSYIFVFVFLVLVFYKAIRKVLLKNPKKLNRISIFYFLGILGWVVYLYFISYNGFIFEKSMPPRFPIFVFIPLIFFVLYFFYSTRKSKLYEAIPYSWPIYLQSFRVVMEVIIFMTFIEGIIPIQATFLGFNLEIMYAITSPTVGYLYSAKPILLKKLTIIWNIVGLLFLIIVVSIVVTLFFAPAMWGSEKELINIQFTQLPLLLLPAFIVPSAIFVHIFSIIQIHKIIKNK